MLWYFNPVEPSAEPTHIYYRYGAPPPDPKYIGAGLANSVPVWMTLQTGGNESSSLQYKSAFGCFQLQKITIGSISLVEYGQKGFPYAEGMVVMWSTDQVFGIYSDQVNHWIIGFVDLSIEVQSIHIIGANGGTFAIRFGDEKTGPIGSDATAQEVTARLLALTAFQPGDITVEKAWVGFGVKWWISFPGRWHWRDTPLISVDGSQLTDLNAGIDPIINIVRHSRVPFTESTDQRAGWWAWFYAGYPDPARPGSYLADLILYGAGPDEGGFDPIVGGKFQRFTVNDNTLPDGLPAEIEVSPWFP